MSDAPAAPVTENGVPPATQEKIVDEVPGFKVFAGNLAYSTTDEGLKAFFAPVAADIVSAQVILRGTRSAGYGFVALSTEEAANKAVELLNKAELDGRPVIVEVAKQAEEKDKEKKAKRATKKKASRRGSKAPPGEVTDAEANGEAPKAEDGATTDEAAKPKKKKKTSRKTKVKAAVASVVPGVEGENKEASPAEGEEKKKAKKPRAARPRRPAGEDPVGELSNNMLFVANLGFNIDDAGLAALFTDAGVKVNSARIVRRRWGNPRKSKGYGFVDVGDEAEQKKAIELLQDKDVGGRPIAVKVAVNSQMENEEKADKAEAAAVAEAPAAVAA